MTNKRRAIISEKSTELMYKKDDLGDIYQELVDVLDAEQAYRDTLDMTKDTKWCGVDRNIDKLSTAIMAIDAAKNALTIACKNLNEI
jgi:hypothetical protein